MKVAYVGREITKGGANLLPILNSLPKDVEWKMFCSKSDLGATSLLLKHRRELRNYDVIHLNTSLYGAFTRRIKKPIVCSVHTIQKMEYAFDKTFRNRLGIFFEASTIKNVDRFLAVSQSVANDLLWQYPNVNKNSIEILPHVAIDSDPLISFKEKSQYNYTVLASGRLVKRKNFGLFVECAKMCPDVPFLLVGEGSEFERLKAVSLPNLSITNYLSRRDYVHFLSNCLVYVLTSKYEGYPTVVFEAMASGTPVLAYPIPALDDLIVDEKTGVCFSSPKEFEEKLSLLIQGVEMYYEIRENARNHVESMPTKKEIASKFVKVYEELL